MSIPRDFEARLGMSEEAYLKERLGRGYTAILWSALPSGWLMLIGGVALLGDSGWLIQHLWHGNENAQPAWFQWWCLGGAVVGIGLLFSGAINLGYTGWNGHKPPSF